MESEEKICKKCLRCYHCSSSTPINLLTQLTPLFEVDPLCKRTFLLALPICDLGKALERNLFELHEVCWTLARVVEERDPPFLFQEEVTRYLHFLTMARSDSTDDRTPPSVNLRIRPFVMMECFHSRGQHLRKFIRTKESVCIRKEFNSHRTGLGHQHGGRFIVLGHQYGRRDVM